jgi:hypothetical protein
MKHRISPKVLIAVAVLGVGVWLYRRRAASRSAEEATVAGWPVGAVPASFSYLSSAAPAPSDVPIGGLNAADSAALDMLQSLTARLVGNSGSGAHGSVAVAPGTHSAQGDPTGSPGARNVYNTSSKDQLIAQGGGSWGVGAIQWTGPGVYEARKFDPTTPGGGSDTRVVRVG